LGLSAFNAEVSLNSQISKFSRVTKFIVHKNVIQVESLGLLNSEEYSLDFKSSFYPRKLDFLLFSFSFIRVDFVTVRNHKFYEGRGAMYYFLKLILGKRVGKDMHQGIKIRI